MNAIPPKYKLLSLAVLFLLNYFCLYSESFAEAALSSQQAAVNQTIPTVDLAELDFQVRVDATNIAPGDVVPFYLTITNTTNFPLEPIALVTMPPNHTSFSLAESTAGWLQSGGDSALCYDGTPTGFSCVMLIDSLVAGESRVSIFAVKVDPNIPSDSDAIALLANIYPADQQPSIPNHTPPVSGQDNSDKSTLFLPFFN